MKRRPDDDASTNQRLPEVAPEPIIGRNRRSQADQKHGFEDADKEGNDLENNASAHDLASVETGAQGTLKTGLGSIHPPRARAKCLSVGVPSTR